MLTTLKFTDNSMKSLLAEWLYPCVVLNWIRSCFSNLITLVNCLLLDKTKTCIWFNICKSVGLKPGTRSSINFLLRISDWRSLAETRLVMEGTERELQVIATLNKFLVFTESAIFIAFKHYIAYIQTPHCLHSHTMVIFRHSFYTLLDTG